MGFVYEKAAITGAVSRAQNKLVSPIAGTSHRISLNDLRPSKAVKREQKKARLAAQAGGGAGRGRGKDKGEVVLDA